MRLTITDLGSQGEGIGRLDDGRVCFVPGAIPGETVEIEIIEDKGSYARAQGGVPAHPCGACGGCPLLRMGYAAQLAWKEKHVRDCLSRIGGFSDPPLQPIRCMQDPYHYRNKAEFVIEGGRAGYYAPKSHDFVSCEPCVIQSEQAMRAAREFAADPVKNAERLVVRTSQTGEILAFTEQKSGYVLSWRGGRTMRDFIDTGLGRLAIEVDAFSFYQVNPRQTSVLYSLAQRYAAPDENATVLDLYCGAGTIGLSMAKHIRRLIGVESVKEAVLMANRNAVLNGIVNDEFICGKAEEIVPQRLQGLRADVVILDPPRAGCKPALLDTVAQIAPARIVYVSCDPATLARDLKLLCGRGYRLEEATPVDMFPHTAHVETVVLLSRK